MQKQFGLSEIFVCAVRESQQADPTNTEVRWGEGTSDKNHQNQTRSPSCCGLSQQGGSRAQTHVCPAPVFGRLKRPCEWQASQGAPSHPRKTSPEALLETERKNSHERLRAESEEILHRDLRFVPICSCCNLPTPTGDRGAQEESIQKEEQFFLQAINPSCNEENFNYTCRIVLPKSNFRTVRYFAI